MSLAVSVAVALLVAAAALPLMESSRPTPAADDDQTKHIMKGLYFVPLR